MRKMERMFARAGRDMISIVSIVFKPRADFTTRRVRRILVIMPVNVLRWDTARMWGTVRVRATDQDVGYGWGNRMWGTVGVSGCGVRLG